MLDSLEQAADATTHCDALSDIVGELIKSGLDCYFMQPLKAAKPGLIVEGSATLGLASVHRILASVVRQVFGRMDGPQLVSICGSIRQLML